MPGLDEVAATKAREDVFGDPLIVPSVMSERQPIPRAWLQRP